MQEKQLRDWSYFIEACHCKAMEILQMNCGKLLHVKVFGTDVQKLRLAIGKSPYRKERETAFWETMLSAITTTRLRPSSACVNSQQGRNPKLV
jgi:hypothetical protein